MENFNFNANIEHCLQHNAQIARIRCKNLANFPQIITPLFHYDHCLSGFHGTIHTSNISRSNARFTSIITNTKLCLVNHCLCRIHFFHDSCLTHSKLMSDTLHTTARHTPYYCQTSRIRSNFSKHITCPD